MTGWFAQYGRLQIGSSALPARCRYTTAADSKTPKFATYSKCVYNYALCVKSVLLMPSFPKVRQGILAASLLHPERPLVSVRPGKTPYVCTPLKPSARGLRTLVQASILTQRKDGNRGLLSSKR